MKTVTSHQIQQLNFSYGNKPELKWMGTAVISDGTIIIADNYDLDRGNYVGKKYDSKGRGYDSWHDCVKGLEKELKVFFDKDKK